MAPVAFTTANKPQVARLPGVLAEIGVRATPQRALWTTT